MKLLCTNWPSWTRLHINDFKANRGTIPHLYNCQLPHLFRFILAEIALSPRRLDTSNHAQESHRWEKLRASFNFPWRSGRNCQLYLLDGWNFACTVVVVKVRHERSNNVVMMDLQGVKLPTNKTRCRTLELHARKSQWFTYILRSTKFWSKMDIVNASGPQMIA